jgi:hypothetical protein
VPWGSKGRDLPPDWEKRRQERKAIAGGRCEAMSRITAGGRTYDFGIRCDREGAEADHHRSRDDHRVESLRWLCPLHHKRKTQREARQARWKPLPPRRVERHPGLR